MKAVKFGRALFIDEDDTHLLKPNTNKNLKDRRIGLYASDEVWEKVRGFSPRSTVEVYCIYETCSDLVRDNQAGMIMGYCHAADGPILRVSSMNQVEDE